MEEKFKAKNRFNPLLFLLVAICLTSCAASGLRQILTSSQQNNLAIKTDYSQTSFKSHPAAYSRGSSKQLYGAAREALDVVRWAQEDAQHGNAAAQYNLGLIYYQGFGVKQDYPAARLWMQKAAQQGDIDAQYNLGLMYALGEGGVQDYHQASVWWQKAAQQGETDAQYNLGVLYFQGLGVEQATDKAKELFINSCNNGNQLGCAGYKILAP